MQSRNRKLNFFQPLKKIGSSIDKSKEKKSERGRIWDLDNSIHEFNEKPFILTTQDIIDSVSYSCLCCGALNNVDKNNTDFQCSNCKMKNTLPSNSKLIKELPENADPSILTLSSIQAQVQNYKKSGKVSGNFDLDIKAAFGSVYALNSSFTTPNNPSSYNSYSIDWTSLREFYKAMLFLPPSTKKAMMEGISSVLLDPKIYPRSRRDIRYMLIILENPLFRYSDSNKLIYESLRRLLGIISNTSERLNNSIIFTMSDRELAALQFYTLIVKKFINTSLEKYLPSKPVLKKPKKNLYPHRRSAKKLSLILNPAPKKAHGHGTKKNKIPSFQTGGETDIDISPTEIYSNSFSKRVSTGEKTRKSILSAPFNARKLEIDSNSDTSSFSDTGDLVVIDDYISKYPTNRNLKLNDNFIRNYDDQDSQKHNHFSSNATRKRRNQTPNKLKDSAEVSNLSTSCLPGNVEYDSLNLVYKKTTSPVSQKNKNETRTKPALKSNLKILAASSLSPGAHHQMKDLGNGRNYTPIKTPTDMNYLNRKTSANNSPIQNLSKQGVYVLNKTNQSNDSQSAYKKTGQPYFEPNKLKNKNGRDNSRDAQTSYENSFLKQMEKVQIGNVNSPGPGLANNSVTDNNPKSPHLLKSYNSQRNRRSTVGYTDVLSSHNKTNNNTISDYLKHKVLDDHVLYPPTAARFERNPRDNNLNMQNSSNRRSTLGSNEVCVDRRPSLLNKGRRNDATSGQVAAIEFDNLDYLVGDDGVIYPKTKKNVLYSNNWGLLAAAKIMKMLCVANSFRSKSSRIEGSRFLVKKLDDFDLSLDYLEWKNLPKKPKSARMKLLFSNYSFLFGIESKLKILKLEAKRQMSSQVNTAFFEAFFTRQSDVDLRNSSETNRDSEQSINSNRDVFMPYGSPAVMSDIFSNTPHANTTSSTANNQNMINRKFRNLNLLLNIRRNYIAEDALKQISERQSEVKKPLQIKFVGEGGVDVGGLTKEFFMLLVREMLDPNNGMYYAQPDSYGHSTWFNPAFTQNSDRYYLFGVVVGLALYNGVVLDLHFPKALYKKLLNLNAYDIPYILSKNPLGRPPLHSSKTDDYSISRVLSSSYSMLSDFAHAKLHLDEMLDDLSNFNPNLASGFRTLLSYNKPDIESAFYLTFEASYDFFGKPRCVPLIHNGQNIPVTQENKYEYVQRYCHFWLQGGISRQFEPFRRGFYFVCGRSALELFFPHELELLISGSDKPLTLSELKPLASFSGISEDDPIIEMFWSVLEEFSSACLKKFLTFVTGCDRLPSPAHPPLKLKIALIGEEQDRLPVSRTCFNQLGIHRYSSKKQLKEKLLLAITDTEGFELQ